MMTTDLTARLILLLVLLLGLEAILGEALVSSADQQQCIRNRLLLGGNGTLKAQFEPNVMPLANAATMASILSENGGLSFPGTSNITPGMPLVAMSTLLQGSVGHVSTVYERCEYGPAFDAMWYFNVPNMLTPQGLVIRQADVVLGCLSRVLQHAAGRRDVLWSFNVSRSKVGCFIINSRPVASATGLDDIPALVDAYFSKAISVSLSANKCAQEQGASSIVLRTTTACPSIPLGNNITYRCLGHCVPYMEDGACCGVPVAVPAEEVGEVPAYLETVAVVIWVAVALLFVAVIAAAIRLCRILIKGANPEYVRQRRFNAGDFKTIEVAEATASAMVMGLPSVVLPTMVDAVGASRLGSIMAATCAICAIPLTDTPDDLLKRLACGDICHVSCLQPYVCNKVRFYDALRCPDCGKDMFPSASGGSTSSDL